MYASFRPDVARVFPWLHNRRQKYARWRFIDYIVYTKPTLIACLNDWIEIAYNGKIYGTPPPQSPCNHAIEVRVVKCRGRSSFLHFLFCLYISFDANSEPTVQHCNTKYYEHAENGFHHGL